jgi:hypothetical protein
LNNTTTGSRQHPMMDFRTRGGLRVRAQRRFGTQQAYLRRNNTGTVLICWQVGGGLGHRRRLGHTVKTAVRSRVQQHADGAAQTQGAVSSCVSGGIRRANLSEGEQHRNSLRLSRGGLGSSRGQGLWEDSLARPESTAWRRGGAPVTRERPTCSCATEEYGANKLSPGEQRRRR